MGGSDKNINVPEGCRFLFSIGYREGPREVGSVVFRKVNASQNVSRVSGRTVSRLHLRRRAAYYLLEMGGATGSKRVFQAAREEDVVQISIRTNAYIQIQIE